MPATAAQVFGPVTVDPGFNTTGEKTLLTMNTTLPAGGKNVILAVFMPSTTSVEARGTFLIKKNGTILTQTYISAEYFNVTFMRAKPLMLMAVDDTPSGNDVYTFTINIAIADSTSTSVHVQGMVIKTDDAAIAYNTTAVDIAGGATATVPSLTTN